MPVAERRIAILDSLPDTPIRQAISARRVLVVEDNLDGVHSLVLLLREMGHKVEYAINGYDALQIAARMRPDFVLLDLGLPGLSGFDVCRRLKGDPATASARIIALTAYQDEESCAKSRAAGCEVHLVKPVTVRVLEELLSR